MVAGSVTGAEGGEQAGGRQLPDLRLWSDFGIPAQRADETRAAVTPPVDPERGGTPAVPGLPPALPPGQMPRQIAPSGSENYFDPGVLGAASPSTEPGDAGTSQGAPRGADPARTSPPSDPFTAAVPPMAPRGIRPERPAAPTPSSPSVPLTPPNPTEPTTPTTPFVPGQFAPAPTSAAGFEPGSGRDRAEAEVPAEFGSVSATALTPLADPELVPAAPVVEPVPETKPRRPRSERHSHRSRMRRQTANGVVVLACLAICFLMLHRFLPDAGGIGSLLETWLPWVGVPVLVLLIAAAIVHTRTALIVTCAAALFWTGLYGPTMLPRGDSGPYQLRIFSEDVNGDAQEATTSGTMALAQHAGVVALEDMYSSVSESDAVNGLNSAYPNHVTEYEFGLWSTYPITDVQPITLGTAQSAAPQSVGSDDADLAASASSVPVIGALKATLTTPVGPLVVYLVHLPQPVLGDQGFAKARDQALTEFVQLLESDRSKRLAVIGDINVAATDRQFSQLTRNDALTSAQQAVGSGFGFTWPAEFPIVRLDDVLTRGLKPLSSVVLPLIAKGQTHLPIQVDLDY